MKKLNLLLLLIFSVISLNISAHDFEAVNSDGKNLYYKITSSTKLQVSVTYRGNSYSSYSDEYAGEITIPSTVSYDGKTYSVTSIGERAFYGCSGLTSVTIPNSVTSIGERAFYGCSGLKELTLEDGEEKLSFGSDVFSNAPLESVYLGRSLSDASSASSSLFYNNRTTLTTLTIGNSVTKIDNYAFYNCSGLTSVTIPNSVTSIGNYAFRGCSGLTSVTIGNSVTSIGSYVFDGCSGLTSIIVDEANSKYDSREECNAIIESETNTLILGCKSTIIPNSVISIGNSAFYGCSGLTSVTIPNSVTSIGSGAFSGCSGLTSVTIPNSVTSIGSGAFSGCSGLTSVTIPNSVTSIGWDAFSGCIGLTSVTIPNSITSIDNYAFEGCSELRELIIENGEKTLSLGNNGSGKDLFYDCPLESLYLGRNISYDYDPFKNKTTLKTLTIGNSITSIGNYAFYGCSELRELIIEDGEKTLSLGNNGSGKGLFYDFPLESLYLGRNISSSTTPFYNKTILKTLTIGNSFTSIDNYAFEGFSKLESVTIGNSVTKIGNYAFEGCSELRELIIENGEKTLSLGNNGSGKGLFYGYPLESVYLGRNLSYDYGPFKNNATLTSLTIGNSVTKIGNYAFEGCTGLKELTIEDSEKTLSLGNNGSGKGLFYDCPLETLYLGRNLLYDISYDEYTQPFYNKTILKTLTIGNSVTSIGNSAFSGCSGLTSVTIPNSVTSIGYSAFYGCSGLKELTIEDGEEVLSFGSNVFSNAPIENVYLGRSLSDVSSASLSLFYKKTTLTSLTIGNGVTSIGKYAFSGCSGLTSVTIPNSVTSIEYSAFEGCSGLTSVTIPNSVTSIGYSAFYGCSGLTSVTIPNSVTSIGNYAFDGCSGLTSITIPNSVTSIGKYAFDGCSGLTSVTIGNSVTSIGYDAFNGCTGLKELIIENGEEILSFGSDVFTNAPIESLYLGRNISYDYDPFKNKTTLKTLTIGNSVTSIGYSAFYGCSGLKELTIEDGEEILSFGSRVFYNAPIESVYLGRSLSDASSASSSPFSYKTTLKTLTIGNSVTSIGKYAFYGCSGLTSATIGNSVTSIGDNAFYGCSGLKELTIEDGEEILSFGSIVFTNAPIESVYLGRHISSNTTPFKNKTTLTSLTIGNSVTSIGNEAFKGCSGLTSIIVDEANSKYDSREECNAIIESETNTLILGCKSTIVPNSVTKIGNSAFYGCSGLKELTIEDGEEILSFGSDVFTDAPIESVYLGRSLSDASSASSSPFYNKTTLTSLTIGNGVTKIGNYAFDGCSGLKELTIEDSEKTLSLGINGSGEGLFKDSPLESLYLGRYISSSTTPFKNKTTLKTLTIGNSVTKIGHSILYGCSSLTSVTIPNSVTSIVDKAFYGCSGLTSVTIPNSVTTIGEAVFDGCSGLKSVTIPNSVTSIGRWTFRYCSGLTSVTIPNSVTSIGKSAFKCCSALPSITIPNSVTTIGDYTFESCTGLKSVTIGNSVTSIGTSAFHGCSGLTEIYSLSSDPAVCGKSPFYAVDKTIPVYIPFGSKNAYKSASEWKDFTNFIESEFTGVEENEISTSEIKVISGNGIEINDYYGKLRIVNLAGQVVKDVYVNGYIQLSLPKGIYIVVTENSSRKVIL